MSLKVKYNYTTTEKSSDVMNVSPGDPYLSSTGMGTSDIELTSLTKYGIEVGQDMMHYRAPEYPFISILYNLGTKKITSPIDSWSDDYEQEAWIDLKLDDLRLSGAEESYSDASETWSADYVTAGYNGKLVFEEVDVNDWPTEGGNDLATTDQAYIEMGLNQANNGSHASVEMGFTTSDDNIVGKKSRVIRKIANALSALKYTHSTFKASSNTYHEFTFESNVSTYLYWSFDDLHYYDASSHYQDHEIHAGISAFIFQDDFSEFAIRLDMDESNLDIDTDGDPTYHIYTQEFDETNYGYTRISRLALIANYDNAPQGIPEGSDFTRGTNFNFDFSQYENLVQIFQSDAYGVTGTRLATKVKFYDDFQISRRRHMNLYKQGKNAACIYNKQSKRFDPDTGRIVRTMSGILDYGTFPIRYIRAGFPAFATTVSTTYEYHMGKGAALAAWFDEIADALNAHKEGEGRGHVLLCSNKIMRKISAWKRYLQNSDSNVLGYTIQKQQPDQWNFNIPNITVDADSGTLTFVEDKALSYMPKFNIADGFKGGLPAHMFSTAPSPRDMIIAFDKSQIQLSELRVDKIEADIQKPGEDIFEEAIRGESSLRLRYPHNHVVIDASEEA